MTSARCARGARFFTLGAVLLLGASIGGAQEPRRPSPARAGITVHGHWIFDVRNPDGSGAQRYEFDNELIDARPLLATLSRQNTPAHWTVLLGDFFGPEFCTRGNPPALVTCMLQEPGDQRDFGAKRIPTLSVSLEGGGFPNVLVLKGTFTADTAGQISSVQTGLSVCANTVAPASPCDTSSNSFSYQFTRHVTQPSGPPSAGGPIPLAAGQIVQVRVEIRFGSASAS
jgi:hypothetical protein